MTQEWLQAVRESFVHDAVYYSRHARHEMEDEEFGRIFEQQVYEAVNNAEVIEEYPDDTPYPSKLLFGETAANERPLHVLCAYDAEDGLVVVITVYEPDPARWIEYRRRR